MVRVPPKPNGGHDADEGYNQLLANVRCFLPFLMIIARSENLGIPNKFKEKFQSLYEVVDTQRLSTNKLKVCESLFCSLFTKYYEHLSDEQLRVLQNAQSNIPS